MPEDDEPPPFSTPRLDAVRAPIPGSAPAGIDMTYEDAYLGLKARVDALGAATGGVDFGDIVDGATAILADRSKDIGVACYLAFGLSRTDGYAGLAEGVAAVRAVAETFWADAFPPLRRMRARQSSMQFMAERLNSWAEATRATPGDREAVEQALAEASALQAFTTEAMADEAPALSGLTRTLREALRQLPAPEPPPAPVEDAPPPGDETTGDETMGDDTAGAGDGASSAPAAATGGFDIATPDDAVEAVLRAAGVLREADPFSATAVLLVRAIWWGGIAEVPPSDGGRTIVPPPPEHIRDGLAQMLASGMLDGLAQTAEDLFPEPPFYLWLDLQRLLAAALGGLGPDAQAARMAVTDATAALARRLPALSTLAFDDGTPFADALTRAWLDEITAAGGGGGGAVAVGGAQAAIREAQTRAGAGDVPGAVAALIAGAGAPRDRFERGVAAAEMCLGADRPDVALALLDDADAAVHAHRLDVWDPAAAGSALRLLHATCAALLQNAASPERHAALAARADDAFARMARLDPGLAMQTTPAASAE